MSKVHILPNEIISKIAAGEVIERPASVIKELLENALDANSSSIEIHIEDAGRTLIHIKDNGHGIDQDDLEKIFLRHATSKISSADDLYAIKSLGFRGEALYSISTIADVVLQSKTINQDSGWEIHMRDGKKLDLRPTSMGESGTELKIKELFFNTPARRKFLKTDTTEFHQILNTFIPYALFKHTCRFLLTHQGKKIFDLTPTTSLVNRIADVLHLDEKHLLEAQHDFKNKNISVNMILGNINIVRSKRDMQFIFINGRPVENKSISYHLNNVYRLIFPPSKYPFFAVFINIPADDLDVNIHPTKRQVKIKNEQNLIPIIRNMCENTLMSLGAAKQVVDPGEASQTDEALTLKQALSSNISESAFDSSLSCEVFESKIDCPSRQDPTDQYNFPTNTFPLTEEKTLFEQKQDSLQSKLSRASYIGSFNNKYLIFEIAESMLIVDQHAAAERITYEELIKQMEKGTIESQHLLSPILLKCTVQEISAWQEAKEKLDSVGFSSTQFDDETIAIHTYPVLLKEPECAVRDLLSGDNIARCDHDIIARRACRSSVMSGDSLNKTQAEYEREKLLQCLDPFTCPHGRPTVIEMTQNFLDKQFLRT